MDNLFKIRKLRLKHTARLEKLIENGEKYDKILKESQIVDKYIDYEMKLQIDKIKIM